MKSEINWCHPADLTLMDAQLSGHSPIRVAA